jgi:hypothetical protein
MSMAIAMIAMWVSGFFCAVWLAECRQQIRKRQRQKNK